MQSLLSGRYKWSVMALAIAASIPAWAGKFNPLFLENVEGIDQHADLSIYDTKSQQLPGDYRVNVLVNDVLREPRTLSFHKATAAQSKQTGDSLFPCLSAVQLADMGVRTDSFPALKQSPAEACVAFDEIIPGATSHFDFNEQKLILSFPQAAMQQTPRGTVPPSRWDEGITALFMDYSFSGSNSKYDGETQTVHYVDENGIGKTRTQNGDSADNNYYLNMRSGFNLGPWRLRNNSVWNRQDGENHWDTIGTWLTRDIVALKSQLTMGDTSTASDIFDSVNMRGVTLASDDEMLPDSQRGFAPVVRGIAKTNAEVVIEQSGYVIYRRFVQPGAFEINDLYPTSNSGDLTVTVKENDGTEQKFVQPYSSVAIFQREGHLKYSVAAGEYRAGNYSSGSPTFGQINTLYGLPWGMTLYGGTLLSDHYRSYAAGLGKNFGYLGAISVDLTQANSDLQNDETSQGQSWRFLYAKSFAGSGTDVRLAGYRYSTSGFYTFQEATDSRYDSDSDYARYHKRSQVQANLTQQMGSLGSVYLNVSQQDYWQQSEKNRTYTMGYNGRLGRVSYSLAYSWNEYPEQDETDRMWSLSFSIPLGSAWGNYRMTQDQDGHAVHQLGLSGVALDDKNLTYNIQQGYTSEDKSNSGSASLSYQGASGNMDVGYNYSKDNQQVNYSLRGGVIVHGDGVTLSQPLNETMILVSAPGANGASVQNNVGIKVDRFGHAVVPYASPYRETEVALRSDTLAENVDLDGAFVNVVPTRGAIVKAQFATRVGKRVLMTLTRLDGGVVPFGATAILADDRTDPLSGIVGEQGELYLSGLPDSGKLNVSWGKTPDKQCRVNYQLPEKAEKASVLELQARCQ
ncbi:outer membrane usher protein LpfC [Enterobacteriaceae bacterium 89]|nr:outer membrane usher protein LpfC [Enterobacteriaceae bacterium 89]